MNLGDFGGMPNTAAFPGSLAYVDSVLGAVGGTADFQATLDTYVYKDVVTQNLFFFYRMSNNLGSARPLQGLSVPLGIAVGNGETALDQVNAGKQAAFGSLDTGGGTVGFVWSGPNVLTAGQSSSWVMLETALKSYKPGLVGVQDGTTANLNSLVPVPEPATYAGLFALGLAGFAAFRRFRA